MQSFRNKHATDESTNYRAYLLRLWRDGENQPWRALLEDPYTGERHGFANLEKAFAYLQEQTAPNYDESGKTIQAAGLFSSDK